MLYLTLVDNRPVTLGGCSIRDLTDPDAEFADYEVEVEVPGFRLTRLIHGHRRADGEWPLIARSLASFPLGDQLAVGTHGPWKIEVV